MDKLKINLNEVAKVKKFVSILDNFKEDVDIISGRFTLDARSIMGLFSLDLSKDIEVFIHTKDLDVYKDFKNKMKEFIKE